MIRALWTSASGMIAQQLNLDVTANNLANVNTTGFKKNRAEFEDLMYQNMKIAGSSNQEGDRLPVGMQVGMGVRPVSVHKIFSQGDFQNTGNQLDLVIEGDGFFRVDRSGEESYTRSGAFKLDSDGRIVTDNGHPLQPEFIVPPETQNIVVTEDGRLTCVDKAGEEIAARTFRSTPSSTPPVSRPWGATSMCRPTDPARRWRACPARTMPAPGPGISGDVER